MSAPKEGTAAIRAAAGKDRRSPKRTAVEFKRRVAAVIGICGAIGAFGGFLILVVIRQASLDVSALVLGSYVVFAAVT